ncbi:MAG: nodulation protein NfeD, partial [Candidatus Competibacterales bacterium]
IVARDIATLLEQASGREVLVNGQPQVLELAGAQLEVIAPDWRSEFLSIITNPNIAFILMLIGIYGLIFEFSNPGALVPGTIGGICLITAFFALDVLPLNYAGLALLILGVALMVAEAFVPSFGILGLGGIVAFAMGATLLFDTEAPGFELSWWVIGSTTAAVALLSMVILTIAVRAQWRPVLGGRQGARGSVGKVVSWSGNRGRVLVDGEVWQATSTAASLAEGQWVQISERRGLVLLVEPNRPPAAYPPV